MATVTKAKSASKKKADIEATLPEEGELDAEVESTTEKPTKAKNRQHLASREPKPTIPHEPSSTGRLQPESQASRRFRIRQQKRRRKTRQRSLEERSEHFLQRIKEVIE